MAAREKRSLLSFLQNLMMHILKWKNQPNKRTNSWVNTIILSRDGIEKIQKKRPSLNDRFVKDNWDTSLKKAIDDAEIEMKQEASDKKLTWDEVFKNKYTLILILCIALSSLLFVF